MAFVGAVAVIWRIAVSFQKSDSQNDLNTSDIIEIRQEMVTQHDWHMLSDSIFAHNSRMMSGMTEIKTGLNRLRNSYVSYLRSDKTLTKDDFLRYMEGIEFELKKKPDNSSWMIPLRQNE
jgi:hypothetical protein